jgi:hypothetical protein
MDVLTGTSSTDGSISVVELARYQYQGTHGNWHDPILINDILNNQPLLFEGEYGTLDGTCTGSSLTGQFRITDTSITNMFTLAQYDEIQIPKNIDWIEEQLAKKLEAEAVEQAANTAANEAVNNHNTDTTAHDDIRQLVSTNTSNIGGNTTGLTALKAKPVMSSNAGATNLADNTENIATIPQVEAIVSQAQQMGGHILGLISATLPDTVPENGSIGDLFLVSSLAGNPLVASGASAYPISVKKVAFDTDGVTKIFVDSTYSPDGLQLWKNTNDGHLYQWQGDSFVQQDYTVDEALFLQTSGATQQTSSRPTDFTSSLTKSGVSVATVADITAALGGIVSLINGEGV